MITVKLDTSDFQRFTKRLVAELPRQLQSAVSKSSRAARTAAMSIAVKEIGLKRGEIADAANSELTAARADGLTAVWRVPRKTRNMNSVSLSGGKNHRPITAKTHVLTKGSKTFKRSFIAKQIAFKRTGPGSHTGKGKDRRSTMKGVHALRTTSVAHLMTEASNPVRITWEKTAIETLNVTVNVDVETAISRAMK